MWRYIKGSFDTKGRKPNRKGYLMYGDKRIELEEKAREMSITRSYLMERLNKLDIDKALDPNVGMTRNQYRPNARKTRIPKITSNKDVFTKLFKALSICGNTAPRGL